MISINGRLEQHWAEKMASVVLNEYSVINLIMAILHQGIHFQWIFDPIVSEESVNDVMISESGPMDEKSASSSGTRENLVYVSWVAERKIEREDKLITEVIGVGEAAKTMKRGCRKRSSILVCGRKYYPPLPCEIPREPRRPSEMKQGRNLDGLGLRRIRGYQ
ncbi:UNVERIFIED_CONTAM: hypothetical protein PYX00_006783 [Menopon gallinae]|uniref:Uncharacterized protein n=1 Tax=Menopon gallinae TaxID=328185 RepID=A0AAW2HXH6_9NEOP